MPPGRRVADGLLIAHSLDEVLAALADGARPIAGGTDLVVVARHGRQALPDPSWPSIGSPNWPGDAVRRPGSSSRAVVSHATLESDATIVRLLPGLADARALVGSPATRTSAPSGAT